MNTDSEREKISTYDEIDASLSTLNERELDQLVGAILGELVDRGSTAPAAAARITECVAGAVIGSDAFDEID